MFQVYVTSFGINYIIKARVLTMHIVGGWLNEYRMNTVSLCLVGVKIS